MPIDIETFDDREAASNPEMVLRYLIDHADQAFTQADLADALEIEKPTLNTVLHRLKKRDLVRHKRPYWAAGDPDRIRRHADYERATARLNEQFGAEDREAWADHAADEPHPNADDADAAADGDGAGGDDGDGE